MTVFYLHDPLIFPDPMYSDPIGLLAIGGDLSTSRLIEAYKRGIFPWYTDETPILWWSPDPRPILEPRRLHIPRSLRRVLNQNRYTVTIDQDFPAVIRECASRRKDGTWLVPEMIEAYENLHHRGAAHSVEAWTPDGELAGGVYGVSLGRAFFGESMFYRRPDASKVAFVHLVRQLEKWNFHFLDCQQMSGLMHRFGAIEIPRTTFLLRLQKAISAAPLLDWPLGTESSEGLNPLVN
ncbi:MAG: leucyl/phenylalanyl-tRNA--protein transferase [Desulfovibrionales bacterium]